MDSITIIELVFTVAGGMLAVSGIFWRQIIGLKELSNKNYQDLNNKINDNNKQISLNKQQIDTINSATKEKLNTMDNKLTRMDENFHTMCHDMTELVGVLKGKNVINGEYQRMKKENE